MLSAVKAEITISSQDESLVEAVRKALSPDNRVVPPGMRIEEIVLRQDKVCSYVIKMYLSGENLVTLLQRARSTTDEVLSIVNMLLRHRKYMTRQ